MNEQDIIYLQQSYVNGKGQVIHALIEEVQPGVGTPQSKFMAMGQHYVALQGMPQPIPIQFQYQIPGDTIAEAFANAPAAFETAKKEAEVQARADHRKRMLANITQ